MKRYNDYSVLFEVGDPCIPEFAWWTGDYADTGFIREYKADDVNTPWNQAKLQRRSPSENFWLRSSGPFCLNADGTLIRRVIIAVPKEVLDEYFAPKFNDYGEVHP